MALVENVETVIVRTTEGEEYKLVNPRVRRITTKGLNPGQGLITYWEIHSVDPQTSL